MLDDVTLEVKMSAGEWVLVVDVDDDDCLSRPKISFLNARDGELDIDCFLCVYEGSCLCFQKHLERVGGLGTGAIYTKKGVLSVALPFLGGGGYPFRLPGDGRLRDVRSRQVRRSGPE
jgi:hypothetical protein